MRKIQKLLLEKSGTSLVELVVTMILSGMLLLMAATALSSAGQSLFRMQKILYGQQILDNVAIELQTQASDAIGYIKIYSEGTQSGIVGKNGTDTGLALEYLNTQGYVELLTTQGSAETIIKRGDLLLGSVGEKPEGILLNRYYLQETEGTYTYLNEESKPIARGVADIFAEKYYMGNYVKVIYSYPQDSGGHVIQDGESVSYVLADVFLYDNAEMKEEHLVVKERIVLEFRYALKRKDGVTTKNNL